MLKHPSFIAAILAASLLNAAGDLIPVVAVNGHHQGDSATGSGSILTAINGAGLTKPDLNDPSSWTHSNAWQDDWQGFNGTTLASNQGWIVFDLGSARSDLGDMFLWNVNENTHSARGVQNFNILFSNAPTLAPPPTSGTATDYSFASGGWTAFGGTQTLAQGTMLSGMSASGIFDLSAIPSARYIGLEFISTYGSDNGRSGISEVAFTTVPEPGSLAFLLLGGLLLSRRLGKHTV